MAMAGIACQPLCLDLANGPPVPGRSRRVSHVFRSSTPGGAPMTNARVVPAGGRGAGNGAGANGRGDGLGGQTRQLATVDPLVLTHEDGQRDREADERDAEADERDREAAARDGEAAERDREAEAAAVDAPAGSAELHARRQLAEARHRAAAQREQAALDRAAAAADRRQAGHDRRVAAAEREDAHEERLILLRDELTGVLRRSAGLVELEREVARSVRSGDSFVVAFVDLDGLKRINDEGGHESGDGALRTVGEALRAGMRTYDIVLRYGGDEFVCILPGFATAEAMARLEALQEDLALRPHPVSITFGLAQWQPGDDIDSLIARADAALYEFRRGAPHDTGVHEVMGQEDENRAIAAHNLLNSSAIVSM